MRKRHPVLPRSAIRRRARHARGESRSGNRPGRPAAASAAPGPDSGGRSLSPATARRRRSGRRAHGRWSATRPGRGRIAGRSARRPRQSAPASPEARRRHSAPRRRRSRCAAQPGSTRRRPAHRRRAGCGAGRYHRACARCSLRRRRPQPPFPRSQHAEWPLSARRRLHRPAVRRQPARGVSRTATASRPVRCKAWPAN